MTNIPCRVILAVSSCYKNTKKAPSVLFVLLQWSRVTKIRTLPVTPGPANTPVLSKTHRPQPNTLDLRWGKLNLWDGLFKFPLHHICNNLFLFVLFFLVIVSCCFFSFCKVTVKTRKKKEYVVT